MDWLGQIKSNLKGAGAAVQRHIQGGLPPASKPRLSNTGSPYGGTAKPQTRKAASPYFGQQLRARVAQLGPNYAAQEKATAAAAQGNSDYRAGMTRKDPEYFERKQGQAATLDGKPVTWDAGRKSWTPASSATPAGSTEAGPLRTPIAGRLPAEWAASAVLDNGPARLLRGAARAAGNLHPEAGVKIDAAELAIRAVTGNDEALPPSQLSRGSRAALGRSIDNMIERTGQGGNGQFHGVQYEDYKGDPTERLILGRFWGRRNPDGSYEVRPDERYDYNAGKSGNPTAEYRGNMQASLQKAQERGDKQGVAANYADVLSANLGMGTEGFGVGGEFRKPQRAPSSPSGGPGNWMGAPPPGPAASGSEALEPGGQQPQGRSVARPTAVTPLAADGGGRGGYQVQQGDTLSDIARRHNTTVEALARKNRISDVNLIASGATIAL